MSDLPIHEPRPSPCLADNVPPDRTHRQHALEAVREYVRRERLVPPLAMQDLARHAQGAAESAGLERKYRDYVAVLVNNELYRPALAAVPSGRRLLLLPQCLRTSQCKAPIDELGLACQNCGACPIGDLSAAARKLGYVVLVAEGAALVMSLIASGRVEAVVGVSCLDALEKVFPYMQAAAVPGVAIPLLHGGCVQTAVDLDWVWDAIYLTGEDKGLRMSLETLQKEVASWFTAQALHDAMGPDRSQTTGMAVDWLARNGKRWRPFLSAGVFQSYQSDPLAPLPEDFRKIALAVECFHKASLIHDDIEDHDKFRYGQKTLHEQYGVPVALNVGDLLLGQGYRLIAQSCSSPQQKVDMLAAAAKAHCELCAGQGAELCWRTQPQPLGVSQVIDIFRQKTAPAFEVALVLGAIYAGANGKTAAVLGRYSMALGIAYQIRDDLDDFAGECSDWAAMRPSILLALAHERATGAQRELLDSLWRREVPMQQAQVEMPAILKGLEVDKAAAALLEQYEGQAIASLAELDNALLKTLLRRVIGRIFSLHEVMGCCDEYSGRNAVAGRRGNGVVA